MQVPVKEVALPKRQIHPSIIDKLRGNCSQEADKSCRKSLPRKSTGGHIYSHTNSDKSFCSSGIDSTSNNNSIDDSSISSKEDIGKKNKKEKNQVNVVISPGKIGQSKTYCLDGYGMLSRLEIQIPESDDESSRISNATNSSVRSILSKLPKNSTRTVDESSVSSRVQSKRGQCWKCRKFSRAGSEATQMNVANLFANNDLQCDSDDNILSSNKNQSSVSNRCESKKGRR